MLSPGRAESLADKVLRTRYCHTQIPDLCELNNLSTHRYCGVEAWERFAPSEKSAYPLTQFRTANVGRLRSLVLQDKEPILLLGAGASVTSGIPLAGTTVEKAARWAWCQENGRHVDDYTIRRSDYWPWVTGQAWFRNDVDLAELYPDAIENLLPVQSDRRQFFEGLINPKGVPPSRGYLALANILQQGWISTVLTTNFDECLQRATVLENKPHRLISIATNDDHVCLTSALMGPFRAIC